MDCSHKAKKWLIKQLLSSNGDLAFTQYANQHTSIEGIDNLYLHIPFCRNKCPYCPYYKETYDAEKAERFGRSLLAEIDLHTPLLKGKEIKSLYIGGGTPTLMNDLLCQVVEKIRSVCILEDVAIETCPEEINSKTLESLQRMGCSLLSLGIQDFHQKHLDFLGRRYTVSQAHQAIEKAKSMGFETLNLDLIFAYPGQTLQEMDHTLQEALHTGVQQLTFYPLFTFPYSSVGQFKNLEKVRMPPGSLRKRMYYHICDTLTAAGYRQVSVWSFLKAGEKKYSSVTRDRFLGLGPSAGTYTGKQFLFNTFHLENYITWSQQGTLPFSYIMDVPPSLERLFWVYWRLYETRIPVATYTRLFARDFYEDYKPWIRLARLLGYLDSDSRTSGNKTASNTIGSKVENNTLNFSIPDSGNTIDNSTCSPDLVLNKKGIHRIHLLQNHFALDFVNKIWSSCTKTPVPEKVTLI